MDQLCVKEILGRTLLANAALPPFCLMNSRRSVCFAGPFRAGGVPERYRVYCSSDFDRTFCNALSSSHLYRKPNSGPDIARQPEVSQRVELRAKNL